MLLGPVITHLAPARAAYLTGHGFFPSLITASFGHGLSVAFDFAVIACLVAAVASLLRGGKYIHDEQAAAPRETAAAEARPAMSSGQGAASRAAARVRCSWHRTARPTSGPILSPRPGSLSVSTS